MAITANQVVTSDTLEKFRQEFNNLRTDVNGLDSGIITINSWIFEGATADDFETTIGVVDPTADRTINFPDESGTVMLSTASAFTNITVADGCNIGSTSDPDAIEIFNKKAIYLYIREITHLNTKQVLNSLTKFRAEYGSFKKKWNE